MSDQEVTIYEIVGGDDTFKRLVEVFYSLVEADETLRPMFPEDLEAGKKWQYLFLRQLFGGPEQYHEERGHPRLRMRHAPYKIDKKAQEAWLLHMLTAIDEVDIKEPARQAMRQYFERGSLHMINSYLPVNDE